MRNLQLAVLCSSVIVAACGDVATMPTQTTSVAKQQLAADRPAGHTITPGSQSPPANAPPEFQHYTSVTATPDVGFNGQTAYGQALVRYSANNVTATVDLVVRNSQGTIVGTNTGVAAASHVFPTTSSLTASTNILLATACGLTANATAKGEVFDSFVSANQSTIIWGRGQDSGAKGAAQPACPVTTPPVCKAPSIAGRLLDCNAPPVGGGGGGGGGSTPPPSSSPPPSEPPYVPPYYSPRPQHQVCVIHGEGTDWEWRECWWVEDNDARIGTGGALRTSLAAPDQASAISSAFAREDRLDKIGS